MSGGWLIVLCIVATISCGSYLTRAADSEAVVTAKIGDPLVLEFNTDTNDTNLVEDTYFTKDGERLQTGPNIQHGRLEFAQLTAADSGNYHFIVTSKGTGTKSHGPIILKVVSDLEESQSGFVNSKVWTGTLALYGRTTRAAGISKRTSLKNRHDFKFDDVIKCSESRKLYDCYTPTIHKYRTIDGTCNNLRRPLLGASDTAFRRVLSAVYEDGVSLPIGLKQQLSGKFFDPPWPSARHLSEQIVAIDGEIFSKTLTHMHMQWGQFLDHDIDLLGMLDVNCTKLNNDIRFCFPIKVKPTDRDFGITSVNRARDLPLRRSLPVCPLKHQYNHYQYYSYGHHKSSSYNDHRQPSYASYDHSYRRPYNNPYGHDHSNQYRHYHHHNSRSPRSYTNAYHHNSYLQAREHINRITHFVDASMVYGSDREAEKALRSYSKGLLKTTGIGKGDLPFSTRKDSRGDPLFMAGDERVNEHTALVVVHTLFHREHNRIATELSRINPCWGDEQLYQEARKIMGAIIQIITYEEYLPALYGEKWFDFYMGRFKYYSSYTSPTVTNVFATAPFRFGHSQISAQFSRLDKMYKSLNIGPLELEDGFFATREYYRSGHTDPILRGLLIDKAGEIDEFLSEGVTSFLIPSPTIVLANDLAALNIQRGRDHALPPYRRWESWCIRKYGIHPSFERLSTVAKFKKLYGEYGFRYGMDLWLAGLAEKHLEGSTIGPTFACLLAETFKAVRDGDRFWWEKPGQFSPSQRSTLSKVTLSQIICESSDGIEYIQPKAFLLSQRRTRCSLLPKLDLLKWRDSKCY